MKLLKPFLKKCFSSYFMWIGFLLSITGIMGNYFASLKIIPTNILVFLIVASMFATTYDLYYKIAREYPDVLCDYDKNLKFEDYRELIELKRNNHKICRKYKVNIKEESKVFEIDGCYKSSVVVHYFHKISIENKTNRKVEISNPIVELLSVNGYENKFFLDRLQVGLQKVTFGEKKYTENIFGDYFGRKNEFKFPYAINKKDTGEIHMYIEVKLKSLNERYFNELIDWVRNIKLSVKFDIVDLSSKPMEFGYTIIYNYKKNMLKNEIEEKVRNDEELKKQIEKEVEVVENIKSYWY